MGLGAGRLFIAALVWLCVATGGATGQPHTRQSLHEFVKDQNKVISLLRGVQEMKARNSAPKDSKEYRTSWEYWANIHGYPGPMSPTGTVAQYQQALLNQLPDAFLFTGLFTGLQDITPPATPTGLAEKVWATCRHSSRDEPALHFLSWHRAYLYFFERVLREASGDPNFSLPYWDYTNARVDPADPSNTPSSIPSLFAIPQIPTVPPIPNPLYERRRTATFGQLVQLDVSVTGVDDVLLLDEFFPFQETLEGGIHGIIHCAVGNNCLGPYIGLVPFSANDPIFWHHHANIDRLWSCWTQRYGQDKNPTGDQTWMNEEFFFVDENGEPASMKASELFDPGGRIDYVYDNETNCFRAPPATEELVASFDTMAKTVGAVRTRTEAAVANNVAVTELEQTIPLVRSGEEASEKLLLAMRPTVLAPAKAVLRLEGVEVGTSPGASVGIYLTTPGSEQKAFVGVISFFALFGHPEHGDQSAAKGRNLSFDVTSQLQELSSGGAAPTNIRILLVATSGLSGDARQIEREVFETSQLTIRKIALEVESISAPIDLK